MLVAVKINITLKTDSDLRREVQILAAEERMSVSTLLARRLSELVQERKAYDRARRKAQARLRAGFNLSWIPPRSRDELHER